MSLPSPSRRVSDALTNNHEKLRSNDLNEEALRVLGEHMISISGNPDGSDPVHYLDETELEDLTEFKRIADSLGWPGSRTIQMHRHIIPGKPAWKNQKKFAKNPVDIALFYRQVSAPLRSYQFGALRIPTGSQPVALGEDGKLYSLRGNELGSSMGLGWGSLPDRHVLDSISTTLDSGIVVPFRPIDYGAMLLSKVLASKIPLPR